MPGNRSQSFQLFQVAGIKVSIHWSWFLVAAYELSSRKGEYESPAWNVAEYLTLFAIVLLHEFGHALACRQTGGKADHITLWPLGGIAFVQPPPRPGAMLWSIAAGPLVNVALVPVIMSIRYMMLQAGLLEGSLDLRHYLHNMERINFVLMVFNLLPIYPLDGGQILRSLLWFLMGRSKSLYVASAIGVVGGLAMIGLAVYWQSIWFGILAAFALQRCWIGFKQAKVLANMDKLPRHRGFVCPECLEAPFQGDYWACKCGARFDIFATNGVCPQCGMRHEKAGCPSCGQMSDFESWRVTL